MYTSRMIFETPHEQVVFCHNARAGLKAIIVLHSTRLGPGLGGVRMFPYPDEKRALQDALRLSEAMTYKAAAAGLPLGGGKAVVIGNPAKDKTPALWKAFGAFVDGMGGRYIAAQDSGTTQEDMAAIAQATRHVTGMPRIDGQRGDPSQATAKGVFLCMQLIAQKVLGSPSLKNVHVALQGVGSVGGELAGLLADAGARLTLSDTNTGRAREMAKQLDARLVKPGEIHKVPADIFAPCALGGVLNPKTIAQLRVKAVVGAANNQLLDSDRDARLLTQRHIAYAPDYVVNAGGLIKLFLDIKSGRPEAQGIAVENIPITLQKVLELATAKRCNTTQAARLLAEERLTRKGELS